MIEINKPVRWTSADNNDNKIVYVGMLTAIADVYYTIDIPGMGELDIEKTDGEFESATMSEYAAEIERDTGTETVEKQPKKTAEKQPKKKSTQGSVNNKLFSVAGHSLLPSGQRKLRFANELASRAKKLKYSGHTEIKLIEVPEGSKQDCVMFLKTHPDFQDSISQELVAEFLES